MNLLDQMLVDQLILSTLRCSVSLQRETRRETLMAEPDAPRPFRIFVSSPGDLGEERLICARVIESLKPDFARVARLEAILWEQEPLNADAGFQEQIVLPSQTDIVVILIWSRLGYRLHSKFKQEGDAEAPTGTIFEFRDALDARRRNPAKTPDMMVYRKTAEPPKPSVTDREAYLKTLDDYERVEAFFNSAFFKDANNEGAFTGAFHTFKRGSEFADNFERHIRTMISRRLGDQAMARSDRWKGGSPFRGLQAFDFEHRALFAGRVRASMEVREALRRQAGAGRAFVLVMGMSGGGKSSLVKAGALPDLVQPGVIEGVALWRRIVFRPGSSDGGVLEGFAAALLTGERTLGIGLPELSEDETTPASLAARLRESPAAAAIGVEGALRHAADAERVTQRERLQVRRRELDAKGQFDEVAEIDRVLADLKLPKARLALVIDQLEEVFTDPRFDDAARSAFIAVIGALARGGRTWVIATLRSDFFARCEQIPELVALKEGDGTYHLLAPNEAEISQMIRHPARSTGLEYEKDPKSGEALSDTLLVAATRQPGSLPLLQFTLDELYKRSEAAARPTLTFTDYRALGGLEGAIAQRAEEVFAAFAQRDPRAVEALPQVFAALVRVTPGENASGRAVSAAVPLERFREVPGGPELIGALIEARLLVSDRGEVRVAHEALLQHWPRLQEWIAQNGEFLLTRARIAAAASRWSVERRAEDFLLPKGKPLVEAEEVLAARRADLTADEAAFIEASSELRHREERAAAARRRKVLLAISAAAVVAVAFAILSFLQYRRADAAGRRATLARNEAEKLIDFMGVDLRDKLKPIGRLELLDDASKRVRAYYESFAAEAANDPDIRARQATSLLNQGEIVRARGDLAGAMKSYREAFGMLEELAKADPANLPRLAALAFAEDRIGSVLRAQGDTKAALTTQRSALARRQDLHRRQPGQARWARDLAESQANLGELLTGSGDLPGALAAYTEALTLDRARAAAPDAPAVARHDVFSSLLVLGETQLRQNALPKALECFREALTLIRQLTAADPKNAPWQRDIAIALEREADVLSAQGDLASALARNREALLIHRRLAALDPSNAVWQSDLFGSHVRIGDAFLAQEDAKEALREFADALAFQQRLIALDPENVTWLRNYGLAHQKMGAALLAQQDFSGALKSCENGLRLAREAATKDPASVDLQSDTFVALTLVGDARRGLKDASAALASYREAIEVVSPLLAKDPSNASNQADRAETEDKVGQLLEERREFPAALECYRRALTSYEKLAGESPEDATLSFAVASVSFHLGRALLTETPADNSTASAQFTKAKAALAGLEKTTGKLSPAQLELRAALEAAEKEIK